MPWLGGKAHARALERKLGRELQLTSKTVKWRLKTMREVFRAELEKLGMAPPA